MNFWRFPQYHRGQVLHPKQEKTAMTRELLISHVGLISRALYLGHWRKLKTRPCIPKPLRCYKCQCYWHHQKQSMYREVCAGCSKSHAMSEWMGKLKSQQKVHAWCVTCQVRHHTWNPNCPARIQGVQVGWESDVPQKAPENIKSCGISCTNWYFCLGYPEHRALSRQVVQETNTSDIRRGATTPKLSTPAWQLLTMQINNLAVLKAHFVAETSSH